MKKIIFICFISFLLLLTACPTPEDVGDRVWVYNHSERPIAYFFASYYPKQEKYRDPIYPDTTFNYFRQNSMNGRLYEDEFAPFEVYPSLGESYKTALTDTLCFFIFDTDTINRYDWEMIRDEYKILQRYDLSLQDIKRLEYTITYPPSEAMKDIKMYPSYGSE